MTLRAYLRYANARLQKDIEQTTYRAYVTDALRALAGGSAWARWYDAACPKRTTDKRSGKQIKDDIQERLRKMLGGESE